MKQKKFYLFTILTCALLVSCQDQADLRVPSKSETSELQSDVTITTVSEALKGKEKSGSSRISTSAYVYTLCRNVGQFYPEGSAVDKYLNLYVADATNNCVWQINPSTGQAKILVGKSKQPGYRDGAGVDINVKLNHPYDVAVDENGTNLYISDTGNNRIRKYSIPNDMISTIVGSGTAGGFSDGAGTYSAKLNNPRGVALTKDSKYLYIADRNNYRIRKYDITNDMLLTVAGNGVKGFADGKNSMLGTLVDIEADPSDPFNPEPLSQDFFFSEINVDNNIGSIRLYSPYLGEVFTPSNLKSFIYFNGGLGVASGTDMYATYSNTVYWNDFNGIANYDLSKGEIWAAIHIGIGYRDATLSQALFNNPTDITVSSGGIIFISDKNNSAIRFMLP